MIYFLRIHLYSKSATGHFLEIFENFCYQYNIYKAKITKNHRKKYLRKCFYHDIYSTKVCKNKNMQLQTIRPENKNYVLFCIVPGKVFLILAKKHSFFSIKCMYTKNIKNKTLVMILCQLGMSY